MHAEIPASDPLEDTNPLVEIERNLIALSIAIQRQTLARQRMDVLESNIKHAEPLVQAAEEQFLDVERKNAERWFREEDIKPGDRAVVYYRDKDLLLQSPVYDALLTAAKKANVDFAINNDKPVYSAQHNHPTKPFNPKEPRPKPRGYVPVCYTASVTAAQSNLYDGIRFSHVRLINLLHGSKPSEPTKPGLLDMLRILSPASKLTFLLACDPEHLKWKLPEILFENPLVSNILKPKIGGPSLFLKKHGEKHILELDAEEREGFFNLYKEQKFEDSQIYRTNKQTELTSTLQDVHRFSNFTAITLDNYVTPTEDANGTAAVVTTREKDQHSAEIAKRFTQKAAELARERGRIKIKEATAALSKLWQNLPDLLAALLSGKNSLCIQPLIEQFQTCGYTTRKEWYKNIPKNEEGEDQELNWFFEELLLYFLRNDPTHHKQLLTLFKGEAEDSKLKEKIQRLRLVVMENTVLPKNDAAPSDKPPALRIVTPVPDMAKGVYNVEIRVKDIHPKLASVFLNAGATEFITFLTLPLDAWITNSNGPHHDQRGRGQPSPDGGNFKRSGSTVWAGTESGRHCSASVHSTAVPSKP